MPRSRNLDENCEHLILVEFARCAASLRKTLTPHLRTVILSLISTQQTIGLSSASELTDEFHLDNRCWNSHNIYFHPGGIMHVGLWWDVRPQKKTSKNCLPKPRTSYEGPPLTVDRASPVGPEIHKKRCSKDWRFHFTKNHTLRGCQSIAKLIT